MNANSALIKALDNHVLKENAWTCTKMFMQHIYICIQHWICVVDWSWLLLIKC